MLGRLRFWDVVRGAATVHAQAPPQPAATIPGWLVQRLILTVGLGDDEIRTLTADEAHDAWGAYKSGLR